MKNPFHMFWFLPLSLIFGFVFFIIGAGDLRKDFILDRYAKTSQGKVDKTWKNYGIPYAEYMVDIRYTPDHNYKMNRVKRGKMLIDYAKPVHARLTRQKIPKKLWISLSRGDTVEVSYALSKGKFYERIHNTRLPVTELIILSLGGLFLLGGITSVVRQLQNR